jgi:predicted ATP-dependent Lon-type protease
MRDQVAGWRASGMSMELYAQKIGVTRHKFEYWVRKIRLESTAGAMPEFIELKHSSKENQAPLEPSVQLPHPQMVLTFPSGACLKVYI